MGVAEQRGLSVTLILPLGLLSGFMVSGSTGSKASGHLVLEFEHRVPCIQSVSAGRPQVGREIPFLDGRSGKASVATFNVSQHFLPWALIGVWNQLTLCFAEQSWGGVPRALEDAWQHPGPLPARGQ